MTIYTPEYLASLSNAQLAEHIYEMASHDAFDSTGDLGRLNAEAERRGLDDDALAAAHEEQFGGR